MKDPARQLAEDEDTEESRDSWLQHRHTKVRLHAQRIEVANIQTKLNQVALGSSDPEVRGVASLLLAAQRFELVLQGKD